MATATRIYAVSDGTRTRLVWAATQAQALRHVAADTFRVEVASQSDLVDLLGSGVKPEHAAEQPEPSSEA